MLAIPIIAYYITILVISLIYVYLAFTIDLSPIKGIIISFTLLILLIKFKSYALFYINLIDMLLISYRYYNKKKLKINSMELLRILSLNLINIAFSVYGLIKIIYYYPGRLYIQRKLPFTRIFLIELAPIACIISIYLVLIVILLSINNKLSYGKTRGKVHIPLLQTILFITLIVLLIILINAFIYFIIHNYPSKRFNGIFGENYLKDPIKQYYRDYKSFSDCIWFSATTFFTVGYGDMHPVGNIMYLLSMLEMLSAYILGVIMIPILLIKVSCK
ncbi:Ion channel [Clostridium sp. N3C]|uniref:potassium channel family protein n=1 Tax=Clostridium sp. N3C TaxID=1776758 RepID=UPI00092E0E2F|nr:potassium channel family protein [Clostridium sp. N3C]SCN26300.1 Ion channel [Clostridium sp. N3C]